MKINWGYRVTILYLGFVGLIIYFVARSMNEKVELVATDYYSQELKYQNKIESIQRNNDLEQPTLINYDENGITILFPNEFKGGDIKGNVHLFRPSDDTKDVEIEIQVGENMTQHISSENLSKGMYRVKVDYTAGDHSYFTEKQIVIR